MPDNPRKPLVPKILNAKNFSDYGDVIELAGNDPITINSGNCLRYSDLASLDICSSGVAGISLFDAKAYASPLSLRTVERHPLGSQAFLPVGTDPYLIVVADDIDGIPQTPGVFITTGYQGVNYRRNTWHSVLTPIVKQSLFVVVDYIGDANNLEEFEYDDPWLIEFGGDLAVKKNGLI